jgi:transposase InsO family protein
MLCNTTIIRYLNKPTQSKTQLTQEVVNSFNTYYTQSITDIFTTNYRCYGYRRIHAEVRKLGISIAEKVIRRLMQEENLIPHSSRKRRQYNSYYGEISPPASNLINRDFQSNEPNTKWLTDISDTHDSDHPQKIAFGFITMGV